MRIEKNWFLLQKGHFYAPTVRIFKYFAGAFENDLEYMVSVNSWVS